MKTVIYITSSLLVTAIGIIVLLSWRQNPIAESVATSFITGGLISLAFSTIRYFDDRDSDESRIIIRDSVLKNEIKLRNIEDTLLKLIRSSIIVTGRPDERAIFSRQLTDEFTRTAEAIPRTEKLYVDILGFSLYRFAQEQLDKLFTRDDVQIRMIVQDPTQSSFVMMAEQEGRDPKRLAEEVFSLTRYLVNKARENMGEGLSENDIPAKISLNAKTKGRTKTVELRWFPFPATVTITRINDVLFVRNRFIGEGRDAPFFFERYNSDNEKTFRAHMEHFESAWGLSRVPSIADTQVKE